MSAETFQIGPFCRCRQLRYQHKPHGFETAQQVAQFYRWIFGDFRNKTRKPGRIVEDKKSQAVGPE